MVKIVSDVTAGKIVTVARFSAELTLVHFSEFIMW